ncbi:response regulator [Paenibacillus sp. JNUCC31]|uniref:response regulator n=1 Tax=Paenibacillus sp. JNUCC-31 TaxID=2777983 RepID=UPI00177B16F2|nr:response regulator [Paenibacillus sp. JNUCC-31]QOS79400.1 response regulator [Paenibacillus sp. JNUCC-31]
MNTIRMILADDEPVILRGLKMLIDWEELGIEIAGEAYDGNELIELIDRCNPDLIVSDICMPGQSGIDVLRYVQASRRTPKVVFISAHKEFDYAQEALKYGALDYLVKPVNTDQLKQVIQKAVSLIRDETEEERKREKLQHLERDNKDRSFEELLDRLTDGDDKAVYALQKFLNLNDGKLAAVCVGDYSRGVQDQIRWQKRERKLIDFAITNVMRESLKNIPNSLFFRKGDMFCYLILCDDFSLPIQVSKTVRDQVRNYLKLDMTIGVGGAVSSLQEAAVSFRQALEALEWAYFLSPGHVIPYDTSPAEPAAQLRIEEMQSQLLDHLIESVGPDALHEPLSRLVLAIKQAAVGNKHTAVSGVYDTLITLRQELQTMGVSLESYNEDFRILLKRISDFDTLQEVEAYVGEFIADIHALVKSRLGNKEHVQIKRVKEYIEANYAQNITLDSIAELIYMNPSYFSTFFKKHTGQNYKQYLTEIRMKHARQMLLHSDLMVYEIAEKVGYNSARLFSDMFRKHYGQIPQEFRQSKGTAVHGLHN